VHVLVMKQLQVLVREIHIFQPELLVLLLHRHGSLAVKQRFLVPNDSSRGKLKT
jgi:hypothetical protein